MTKLLVTAVDYDLSSDTIIASVCTEANEPVARVELQLDYEAIRTKTCGIAPNYSPLHIHVHHRLAGAVLVALYEATTEHDEILYVPADSVFPLSIEL